MGQRKEPTKIPEGVSKPHYSAAAPPPPPQQNNNTNGYFLSQDQDGHWYIIPTAHETHWNTWNQLDNFSVPDYAIAINGAPRRVVFGSYFIR